MAFQPPPRQAVDAGFVETIRHLLGADNNARNQAEQRYDAAKRSEPVQLVASLVQVLTQTDLELPVREQCAVLLRQCCGKVKEPESTWQKLGTHQAQLRGQLLQILEAEPNQQLRRKVSDCVQSLANQIVEIEEGQNPTNLKEWPELMPCLFRIICDGSKDSTLRADCLWIVKELTCSVWQMLLVNSSQTFQVLQTCLADPAQTVKAEAAALLCSFVDDIPSKEGRKPFQPLIPEVTSVMAQLASNPEPKELNTVLQALQSTTETADFFKQHIASHLIPVLENIAMNHPDESARKYAFEVIVSFMESKPKTMLKVPDYIQKALSLCVTFMMQLNDDMATWMQQDDEDDEDEEFFNIGKESVDRISRCAAKVEAFPLLLEGMKQAVSKLFQSGEWKQVVAGISTLSMIAEYVDDEATVSQMTNGIKMQLAATNAASSKARQLHGRGHAWLLFFGILICQPLTQAFCGARQAVRHPAVRLQAEAKQGSKSPVKELEEKLSKALGRKIKKGDMVWTYQASVELPCLSDISSSLVGGRVTFDAANADECKRKAASAVLEALDFEKLAEEAGAAGAAAAGAAPKEAKKPKKDGGVLKDLEIGQKLNTKVVRKTRNGLRLDWKGKEVTLPASEVSDTFPVNVPQNGQKVKVRVLSKEKGTVVTMREGSLERPEKENVQVDLSALEGLDRATKLEAEVLGFTWQDAAVKVVGADGKVTLAQLPRKQFTEGAEKELAIGSKIQVRKKYLTKDRALVSMKDPPSRKIEDLVPGEELSGTVESLLFSNNYEKPAAFLDVGFDRPAYLDWQEASDTYPGKAFRRLKVGKPVTGRVLRVQDDRIYVTCRSGDLYRPTFSEAPPQALQEIVDKFSNLPKDEYLDARVLRLFPRHAVVTVKMPDGTEAEGYIPASYYTRSFEESGAPNDQIKVRLLPEQPKARGRRSRVMLTLKDGKKDAEEKQDASEATVKEEVAEAAKEPETAPPEPEKTEPPKDDGPLKGLSDFLMR